MSVFSCIRSLYIDWRIVVVVGDVLHHVKSEGNCPGGEMSGGICPRGNVLHSFKFCNAAWVHDQDVKKPLQKNNLNLGYKSAR